MIKTLSKNAQNSIWIRGVNLERLEFPKRRKARESGVKCEHTNNEWTMPSLSTYFSLSCLDVTSVIGAPTNFFSRFQDIA